MQNKIRYTCKTCNIRWQYEYEVVEEQRKTHNVIFFERVVMESYPLSDATCHICDKSAEAEIVNPMPRDKRTLVRVRLLMETE